MPGVIGLAITNGFTISGGNSVKVRIETESYQLADDISIVRGRHQMSFGGNVSFWTVDSEDNARAAGDFNFNGQATGLALADFLTGQTSLVRHGAPGILLMNQWYMGAHAQDTWRATDRVTVNAGLRWEPYFGQNLRNGAVSNFLVENFRAGIKTKKFLNAPAGLIYPGDAGFPAGDSGIATQWRNCLAARRRGLGRHRRRPDRGPVVLRDELRFPQLGLHVHRRVRVSVREPRRAERGAVRGSRIETCRVATRTRCRRIRRSMRSSRRLARMA